MTDGRAYKIFMESDEKGRPIVCFQQKLDKNLTEEISLRKSTMKYNEVSFVMWLHKLFFRDVGLSHRR